MNTFKYKTGYIHENFTTGMVMVQMDSYAYPIEVKSVLTAKRLITLFIKNTK
jgi:hypothetical protein